MKNSGQTTQRERVVQALVFSLSMHIRFGQEQQKGEQAYSLNITRSYTLNVAGHGALEKSMEIRSNCCAALIQLSLSQPLWSFVTKVFKILSIKLVKLQSCLSWNFCEFFFNKIRLGLVLTQRKKCFSVLGGKI